MVSNSNQAVSSDLQSGQLQPAVCSISIECETLQQEEKVLARRLTAEAGRYGSYSFCLEQHHPGSSLHGDSLTLCWTC
jgi:hypothetical protein